ncbi:MAG: hypothetical protein M3386_08730, partial [Actinomycetota bacterium]|nr:hypothetical protein [Actinomycetota bacterium]
VRVEPPGRPVVVVSTDGEVAADTESVGARAVPSATLLAVLSRSLAAHSHGTPRTVGGRG